MLAVPVGKPKKPVAGDVVGVLSVNSSVAGVSVSGVVGCVVTVGVGDGIVGVSVVVSGVIVCSNGADGVDLLPPPPPSSGPITAGGFTILTG